MTAPPRILLVCTANICRSPMAEALLRQIFANQGLAAVIDSAATHDTHAGMPPHPMAVVATKRRGIDITRIRARPVCAHDFERFDLILAMDRANRAHLRSICPRSRRHKIRLLLDFNRPLRRAEVGDPYGGSWRDFERALRTIHHGCKGVVAEVRRRSIRAERENDARWPLWAATRHRLLSLWPVQRGA